MNVGDKVWLLRWNLKTYRPSDKLDYRRLGPFQVIKQINKVAYRLDLPPSIKIHPIFHVSLLELYKESSIFRWLQVPLPPIEMNGEEEFKICEVLDSRIKNGKIGYVVHWQSYKVHE